MRSSCLALAVIGSCLVGACQQSDTAWPSHALNLEVGYVSGGSADGLPQVVAHELGRSLHTNVAVARNGLGRAGVSVATAVARAPKDGYTLLLASSSTMFLMSLLGPGADAASTELCPIALVADTPEVLLVSTDAQVESLQDVIIAAQREPSATSFASLGTGSIESALGALLAKTASIELTEVPYRSSAMAVEDVLSGEVSIMFSALPAVLPAIRSGRLRPLAITSRERVPELSDTPTFAELGLPDLSFSLWYGLFSPCGLEREVEGSLLVAARDAVASENVAAVLGAETRRVPPLTGEDFGRFVDSERARWLSSLSALPRLGVSDAGSALDGERGARGGQRR